MPTSQPKGLELKQDQVSACASQGPKERLQQKRFGNLQRQPKNDKAQKAEADTARAMARAEETQAKTINEMVQMT